jgi:hypothetical protein
MATSNEDLTIRVGADASAVATEFSKLADKSKELFSKLGNSFNATTVMSIAGGQALEDFAKNGLLRIKEAMERAIEEFARFGNEIEHMQLVIGGSTESLSNLAVSLAGIGVSTGQYESVAFRLSMRLEQSAEKFSKYGIAIKDSHGALLDEQTIISSVISKLNEYTAGTERNKVGTELLGRSYRMLTDMMKLTREEQEEGAEVARNFGMVMSDEDKEAAHKFEIAMNFLGQATKGFFVEVGRNLSPALTDLANLLRDALVPVFDLFKGSVVALSLAFEVITAVVVAVVRVFLNFVATLELGLKMFLALAAFAKGDLKTAMFIAKDAWNEWGKTVVENVDKGNKAIDEAYLRMQRRLGLAPPEKPPGGKGAPAGEVDEKESAKALSDAKALLAELKASRDSYHQMTAADEAAYWRNILQTARLTTKDYISVWEEMRAAENSAQKKALEDFKTDLALRRAWAKDEKQAELDDAIAVYNKLSKAGAGADQLTAQQLVVAKAARAVSAERLRGDLADLDIAREHFKDNEEAKLSIAMAYLERLKADTLATDEAIKKAEEKVTEARKAVDAQYTKDYLAQLEVVKAANAGNATVEHDVALAEFAYETRNMREGTAEYNAQLAKRLAADQKYHDEKAKLLADDLTHAEAVAASESALQREVLTRRVTLGMATQKDLDAFDKAESEKKYALERRDLELQRDLWGKETVEYKKYGERIDLLDKNHRLEMEKFRTRDLAEEKKKWDAIFGSVNSAFSGMIKGIITGTQTLQQGLANIAQSIALSLIDNLVIKPFTAWLEKQILMLILGKTYGAVSAEGDIATSAAKAGAAGVASMAGAPWPIDMTAPAFGASMFADAMTYAGLAAHEKGVWDIPRSHIAMVHRGEMIVPNIGGEADAMRSMLAGLKRTTPVSGGGGSMNVHIQAWDANDIGRFIRNNASAFKKGVLSAQRSVVGMTR